MQRCDCPDQGKAKAGAVGRAAAIEAIEAIEHLVALGLGNAGTVVADLDLDANSHLAQDKPDRAAGRGMGERILDQVRHHLRQQLTVAGEGDAVGDQALELVVGILGRWSIGLGNAAHQGAEVDAREGASLRTGFDLGDAQESGKDLEQGIGFGDGGVGCRGILGRVRGVLAGVFETLAQAAERRAQVMGDVAGDLAQSVEQLLDALQHGVQAVDQLVDLVVGAAHGNSRREVALHGRPAGAADRIDAAHEAAAEQPAAADCQQERQPARPDEGAHDRVLHVDQAAGILRHQQERAVAEAQAISGEPVAAGIRLIVGSVAHEVDDTFDRRHARQVANHDLAGRALQQVIDRAAGAEIHASRDLLGKTQEPAAAIDLGQLQGLGPQHLPHVALHRRRGGDVDRGEQRTRRHDEQPGIEQRQTERRRAQDPERSTRARG